MSSKRAALTILAVLFSLLAGLAVAQIVIDPYQVFHRSFFGVTIPGGNDRFRVVGLINSFLAKEEGYSSIVIGTSYEMGYDPRRLEEKLGWGKGLNLSIAGGFAKEKRLVLTHALRTGKVRTVLWGMFKDYAEPNPENVNPLAIFPESLYYTRPDVEEVLRYLLGWDTMKQSLVVARGWGLRDITGLGDWNPDAVARKLFEAFNTPDSLKEQAEVVDKAKPQMAEAGATWTPDQTTRFPSVDTNIVAIVAAHPEVEFRLVFGPLSLAFFHTLTAAELKQQMSLRSYIVKATAPYPNVRVYGFEADAEVTGNLANYRDSCHYGSLANNRVVDAIAVDKMRLTPDNVDGYVRDLLAKVQAFRVHSDRAASLWQ